MSNYTKSTNFATKDNLTPGDPLKVVRGTEIDTEFNNIATAVATKTDNSAAAITGGSITGITDLAIADGGTGASTATAALNNLLPSQTSNANKYLQTDGTNATWDAVTLSTADITGTLPVANGGTGVTSSTGTGSVVLSNSPTLVTPALGTPASGVATNLTGLPISTGVSGLGSGVATFLGTPSSANLASAVSDETGSGALVFANSPTLVTPTLGTPASATLTNATGLPVSTGISGLGTGVATFLATPSSANLRSALTDETGTGSAVFATSPALVTPDLGTPSAATLTNATGLPISTGVSGLGTGVATALAVNVGSAGAPVVNGGALGTPSSGTVTNLTGTASININGTVGATTATTGAFTTLAASGSVTLSGGTANGVTYLNGSKVLTSGSALTFDGTNFAVVGGNATINRSTNTSRLTLGGSPSANWEGDIQFVTSNTQTNWRVSSNQVASGAFTITPSTAGGGSTFTSPAILINSSSNVGIGTSSPTSILNVSSSVNNSTTDIEGQVRILNTYSGGVAALAFSSNDSDGQQGRAGITSGKDAGSVTGYLSFATRTNTGAFTERMRLDSSGNLGLGVTPSANFMLEAGSTASAAARSFKLMTLTGGFSGGNYPYFGYNFRSTATSGTYRYEATDVASAINFSGGISFNVAASGTAGNAISFTQAMTLTAAGNLCIGRTSVYSTNAERLSVEATGNSPAILAINAAGATDYTYVSWNSATTGDNKFVGFFTEASPTLRGSIDYNRAGGVTRYNTSSDATLKNINGDAPKQISIDILNSTKIREYSWKDDATNKVQIGVIAQELHETFKGAVSVGGDKVTTDAEGNETTEYVPWAVDKTAFTFHLVAGWQEHERIIQEQQALIVSLKARLDAANL